MLGFFGGEVNAVGSLLFDVVALVVVFVGIKPTFPEQVEVAVYGPFGRIQKRSELVYGFMGGFLQVGNELQYTENLMLIEHRQESGQQINLNLLICTTY